MKEIIRILGSIVFTAVMYCVPILLTCSFCFGWDSFVKLLLCFCACGQFAAIFVLVLTKAEE